MKVLHVLDTSIPDNAGYTTRGYYLAKYQKMLGWEPVVLTSERFSNPDNAKEEEIDRIRYYRTDKQDNFIKKIPIFSQIAEVHNLERRVVEVARRENVQIIHAHSPSLTGAACVDYCRTKKIPLVYEIRAFWEDAAVDRGAFAENSLKYKLRRWHETRLVKKADAVIAICNGIKNDLLGRGIPSNTIHVVRNGVDCELFQPAIPNITLINQLNCFGKTVIGFIGSFFNFEGLFLLITAMREITSQKNDVILLLVGKGQADSQLRKLTKDYGLEDKVIFVGQVPHDKVKQYYSVMDVLVYPRISKRITEFVTPLKPLEAMAMQKTVLMSDVGGLRELAEVDGVAQFFRADDKDDLIIQCLKLCSDVSLRRSLGRNARKYVLEYWDWKLRAKEDLMIYSKLLS